MDIYRGPAAQPAVRAWCERALEQSGLHIDRGVVATSLGPTHVTRAGSAGPAVLVLPGTNLNAATSLPLLEELATRFRASVVDIPGQPGLSGGDRPDHDHVDRYQRWLDDVIAALGGGPVTVLGHSLGAAIALCATPGPHIRGLVLACPAGLISAHTPGAVMRVALPWLARPSLARSARLLAVMSGPAAEPDPHLVEWMTLAGTVTRTSRAPAPLPGSVLERWRATPVAVLAGSADHFFPPVLLAQRGRLWLAATTRVVGGCGHLLPYESPRVTADAVADLVAESRPPT